jgi:hypothetical protein
MDDLTLFVFYLFGITIGLIVFYYIIRSATGTNKRKKQLLLQNKILLQIAKKLEVDEETVNQLNDFNNNI